MTRIARRIPVAAAIWRRDNPYAYFEQVAAALADAGIGDFHHYDLDRRDCIDAWIQLSGARDITWSPDALWRRGWHLTSKGGRHAGGPTSCLTTDVYPDPAAVVAAARAALEET